MNQAETFAVTVIAKQFNGTGNLLLTLKRADALALPSYTPGAHIDVAIPHCGKRQYSLCSAAEVEDEYQICVRLDAASAGGSHWLHHQLNQGDSLTISAPRNHFPLPTSSRTLLFAAGIGLTPLLVMAEALAARAADFTLHLYLKNRDELAFSARLKSLGDRVVYHFSSENESLRQHIPDDLLFIENSVIVACGPEGFMQNLQRISQQYGWNSDQFYTERFKPSTVTQPINTDSFDVEIASSGARFTIKQEESIAEVLEREGIEIDLSCEQGMCGTCVTRVLAGQPDHRDDVLNMKQKAANNCIVLCCSRSHSPLLVLDL